MTKAELNAHWALPDETPMDSYTITHKREREAYIKGWHKAFELACEWLKEQDEMIGVSFQEDFLERFKNYMEGE